MSSQEYIELKAQMDRIETQNQQIVALLSGRGAEAVDTPKVIVAEPDVTGLSETKRIQAEAHFILESQGLGAYKRFLKQQARQSPNRRVRQGRAA